MSFGSTPKDSAGIPVSSVYVPNSGFIALQGIATTTDGSSNQSALVIVSTSGLFGYISGSGAGATTANTDYAWTFAQAINHGLLQNASAVNLYFEFDTAATTNSPFLVPGSVYEFNKICSVLHFLTPAATTVNVAGGIIPRGWL